MRIAAATRADIGPLAALWHDGWHEAHAALVPTALTALRTPAEFRARVTAHLGDTSVGWVNGEIAGKSISFMRPPRREGPARRGP